MSEDYGKDASVVVDEALLAAVRGHSSHGSEEPAESHEVPAADDGSPADRHTSESPDESCPGRGSADGTALEMPVIEGYGALREIGRGGFSSVFEALEFEFERWVAVKVLDEPIVDDDAIADFERECRAMGGLSGHPNIVTVFSSAFTDDRRPCIVMELFPHGNYLNILQRTGPLGLEQLLPVSVRVAGALATAHNRGMVHGDVKPQNIFRSQYELAALGDFGIATLISHRWGSQKTRMSLYYAAPEIIERGVSAASPFADQYSLAATIYTLATGTRPYEGDGGAESTRDVLVRTLSEPPPRLGEGYPAELGELLHMAMSRRLQDRLRDLREFAEVLVEIEQRLGLSATAIRVGSDAGRYLGGVVDLSGSSSRSAEPPQRRSTGSSRERSMDRAATAGTKEAGAGGESGDLAAGATPPAVGGLSTGDRDRRQAGASTQPEAELSAAAPEATVVRPQRPAATAAAPQADAPKKRSPKRLWVGMAVAVVALGALAAVAVTRQDDATESSVGDGSESQAGDGSEPPAGDDSPSPAGDGSEPPAGDDSPSPAGDGSEPPAGDGSESSVGDGSEPPAEAPPGALDEIHVDGQRNGFVVRWEEAPDATPPILYYRVQWRSSDQLFSEAREMLVDSDETSAVVSGLASDTEYRVRVAAENAQGAGDWTESGGFTVPDGVPDPPTLHVSPLEEGLAVAWDEPWDGGWPITGYVVEWEDSGGKIHESRYAALSSSAEILDLIGGEAYRVRVAAENENGRGGWVEETAIAAVPVPAAPGGLAVVESYRSLQVTWEDPPAGGPPITEYRLELSTADREAIAFGLSPDDTSAEIEGLLSGRLYDVRLLAVNGDAPSDPALAQGVPLDRVAFASDHEGRDAIYYVDARVHGGAVAVSDPVRVTDNGARLREGSPSWSPDGGWIAFQRRHPEGTHWQVFVKNIATGEERRLVCGRDNGWGPDWSPDGSLIAYARGSGGNDIWTINIGTGEAGSIKDEYGADDAYLSWSPDGDAIAFARRDHDPRRSSLYNSRNPREIRVLTGVASEATALGVSLLTEGYEEGHYSTPEWSPEGNEIAYSVSLSGSRDRHIEVMDRDGNRLRRLTSEHHDDDPSWSPNGGWVALARGFEGSRGIYVVDSSGGEPTQLLGFPGNDYWAPSWAPNSDVAVDPTFDCRS